MPADIIEKFLITEKDKIVLSKLVFDSGDISDDFFGSRYIGTDNEILFGSPATKAIANVFGIPVLGIKNPEMVADGIHEFPNHSKPVICEIQVDSDQELNPRMGFVIKDDGKWLAKPLEGMYPFLPKGT